jgi:cellulose synthase (UDP-forming)
LIESEARRAPAGLALAPPPASRLASPPVVPDGGAAAPAPAAGAAGLRFERLIQGRDRVLFAGTVGLWLLASYSFWSWWLRAEHVVWLPGFALNTLLIALDLLEPLWFYFFVWRMRRPVALGAAPRFRVAAATTKTPSEPLEVVGPTQLAIRAMAGEHDTWLLDEGGDPAVRAWCEANGIRYFSRHGVAKYQQPRWPFQSRMKAGNYNAWLDHVGFDRAYDVLCQFDSDHRPRPDFLARVLPVLADDEVAYVSAPSICVGNRDESWTVLGRAEIETAFHGPLQTGFNDGYAPLIIGSHCTFRLSALREIGGFQTTWCEDHDNTLAFNSLGYRGVFQMDAIAVGDGPSSFAEAMQQEYQWSRGLVQILLNSTPLWLGNLPPRQRMQFLFCQCWYPRLALVKLALILLPGLALLTGHVFADVNYLEFWLRELVVGLPCLAVVHLLWARGWTRPAGISYFSWRTVLFLMARWPWILLGVSEAVVGRVLGRDFAIKVTAKGRTGPRSLPLRALGPYLGIVAFSSAVAAAIGPLSPRAGGYGVVALVTATWYAAMLVAVVLLHLRENARHSSWRVIVAHNRSAVASGLAAPLVALFGLGAYLEPIDLGMPRTAWSAQMVATVAIHDPAAMPSPAEPGGDARPAVLARLPSVTVMPDAAVIAAGVAADTTGRLAAARAVAPDPFPPGRVALGAFDPDGALAGFGLATETTFHSWSATGADPLGLEIDRILARGRAPVVTLQPRPRGAAVFSPETLIDDIGRGAYDQTIRAYAQMARARQPDVVVVRFAPEMELVGANGWALGSADAYARAYRHVVDVFRAESASNVRWLWSPAGNDRAAEYYPGDDYVDLVGLTVLASQEWDRHWGFATTRGFAELLGEKYPLAERLGKPLVVAELGVAIADPAEEARWLRDARASFDRFPLLRGVSYFNARQPRDPPQISVFPDWRLRAPEVLFGPAA